MAPTRLDLLPAEVVVKIYRFLMNDVVHQLQQYVAYVAMDGKVWPLGNEYVMTWDNRPIDNSAMKIFGNRYAPRFGCGCMCDNETGFLTFYCGCGFAEEGASYAGYAIGVVVLWDMRIRLEHEQLIDHRRVLYV